MVRMNPVRIQKIIKSLLIVETIVELQPFSDNRRVSGF